MKLRVRQMPNGKWICEGKRVYQRKWRGLGFSYGDSILSIERKSKVQMLHPCLPEDGHYATCWHETRKEALLVKADVESYLGR